METQLPKKLFEILGEHLLAPHDKQRERIILAAKKRFLAEGFARTTIGDLCHSMRISKKTFYKYFKDKEDLVLGIIASNLKIFVPIFMEIFTSSDEPKDRFEQVLGFFTTTFPQNITVAFMADVQRLMPEIWEGIDQFRRSQIEKIIRIIQQGREAGQFSEDFDPEKLGRFIYLIATRILDPRILFENDLQLTDVVNLWSSMVRHGIYARTDKKEGD